MERPVELTDEHKHRLRETLYNFWYTHGVQLESENGPDTFKHELVQKMGDLHADISRYRRRPVTLRGKIQDVVSLQRRHIMQFEFRLDEFNRYLAGLQLLGVVLQPGAWNVE